MKDGKSRLPGLASILASLALGAVSASAATGYEVYALRYAVSPGFPVASLVAGAAADRKIDLPFIFWALKSGEGRTVLVDAGCYKGPAFEEWKLKDAVTPAAALGRIGLRPQDVTDVIVTHVHWDHVGGVDLFPRSRVWIQREEFDHHVDSSGKPRDEAIEAGDAAMLAALKTAGRLHLVDGDAREIIPGITVYTGGKHTFASQYVGVRTAGRRHRR